MHVISQIGTLFFALAILHTFAANSIRRFGHRFKEGSILENLFHFLGEVEIAIGLWATAFIIFFIGFEGKSPAIAFLNSRSFAEPLFVFVIMVVCASKPILVYCEKLLFRLAACIFFLKKNQARYLSALVVGPILGSFITEPAAMTVTALFLYDVFLKHGTSKRLRYVTLATLFVNVSVGGTLTPYAAPPVLMVVDSWHWDMAFMLTHFSWKAVTACFVNAILATTLLRDDLSKIPNIETKAKKIPVWVFLVHLVFVVLLVLNHRIEVFVIGLFLFFLGFASIAKEYQSELKLKEGLLVGFFLAGLVILGAVQAWWLRPLFENISEMSVYLGAAALTSITDNAALTYLGAQVPNLSESIRYYLVAGAVVGGGLTVIANAPNPAGFSILGPAFGKEGISPLQLFLYALTPTTIALLIFSYF